MFWCMAVIFGIQLIGVPLSGGQSFGSLIGLVIAGLSLIPLYGYAYGVAIGSKGIAIAIFSFNSLVSVFGVISLVVAIWEHFGVVQIVASSLGLVFAWLYLYPQFAYAFRSNALWSANA